MELLDPPLDLGVHRGETGLVVRDRPYGPDEDRERLPLHLRIGHPDAPRRLAVEDHGAEATARRAHGGVVVAARLGLLHASFLVPLHAYGHRGGSGAQDHD